MKRTLIIAAIVAGLIFSCGVSDNAVPSIIPAQSENPAGGAEKPVAGPKYTNPVIDKDCPDPSVLDNRSRDGYFYAYSTNTGGQIIPIYRSRDLMKWEPVGAAFNKESAPSWLDGGKWAPDINYIKGKYVLYYCIGVYGDGAKNCSGVAVSDNPAGPFVDKGMVVSPETTSMTNCLDPNYFEDSGKKYLLWGGYGETSGIHIAELSDDGLSLKPGATITQLGKRQEGSYLYKRNGYYYLFGSMGSCCENDNSTYHLVVGRSSDILGPYKGRGGAKMTEDTFGNIILKGSDDFIGPGHNGEITIDDNGNTWMVFHCYTKSGNWQGRRLCLQQIKWDSEGWPYFDGDTPCTSANGPYFKH